MKRSCWDFYPGTGEPKGHCHESIFVLHLGLVHKRLCAVNIFWEKMVPLVFYYTNTSPLCEVVNLQIKKR